MPRDPQTGRERVIPTGEMHLVIRLGDDRLRLYDEGAGGQGRLVDSMLIGGLRESPYWRDPSSGSWSVGAQLRVGATTALLGVPAEELTGRHTSLEDVWGLRAGHLRERLLQAPGPSQQIDLLEAELLAGLRAGPRPHPAVMQLVARLAADSDIAGLVVDSGLSHRRLAQLFRRHAGLTPKRYTRLLRLQGVISDLSSTNREPLAMLATAHGFSDQAHLSREFMAFTGLTPSQYRSVTSDRIHHLEEPLTGRWPGR